ncbi:MAG: hypothetical protein GXP27_01200 [Planctomycetes bacterium]|nr:hypothetical protein [Planctomycetota bacterium]
MERPRSRVVAALLRAGCAWLALCFAIGEAGTADEPSGGKAEYRAYQLHHKPVTQVRQMLEQILADAQPKPHLVADGQENVLLVRGSESVHRLVQQVIESVDRPTPSPQKLKSTRRVVRVYNCPADRLRFTAEALQKEFPEARIAVVADVSQIVVLAEPAVQEAIARHLSEPAPRPVHRSSQVSPSDVPEPQVERVVLLRNATLDRVEHLLTQLLSPRLAPLGNQPGRFQFVNSKGRQARLTLDATHRAVEIAGDQSVVTQFERLVRLIDQPESGPGFKVRILPVRRADPAKIRQAVEAYRGRLPERTTRPEGGRGGAGRSSLEPGRVGRRPPQEQSRLGRGEAEGGIQQASFQQGPAGKAAATAEEGQPEEEEPAMREPGSMVDIETLPDLDVIILRGREADVEELTRIIEEIERLSVEKQPTIDIVYLKHIKGEALMQVLQQVQQAWLGGRQGRVSVLPLVKPNALLLIGWGEAMEAIKTLIQKLDQPVQASTQFRVFRLKHAPVSTVQSTVQQFFSNRGGLGPQVRVTADARTNSLVVEAAPRDMEEVALLIQQLDTDQSEAVMQTRIFHLKNTLAANTAQTLLTAIQAAAGGAAGQKSSVLELLTIDAKGRKRIKSGLLADVRITPDVRANSLIVFAPAQSMGLIEALIHELDDKPAAVAQIKVFRILNGDATSLVRMLQTLLPTQAGATAVPQLPTAEGEEGLVPIRFAVDIRTNSIIATGSAGDLQIIEALLLRLDEKDVQERKNTVYRLKNSPANDVARALSEFLRSERAILQAAPGAESPYLQIEREVIVVSEPVTNSLIISATAKYYDRIIELIEQLDAQPPQVLIQVLIAEVVLGDADEFGIEAGIQDSVLFNRSILDNIQTITRVSRGRPDQQRRDYLGRGRSRLQFHQPAARQ